jgi:hypothetical protein
MLKQFLKNEIKIFSRGLRQNLHATTLKLPIYRFKLNNFSEKSSKDFMKRHVNDPYVKKSKVVNFFIINLVRLSQ